jgi:hypothetical protein
MDNKAQYRVFSRSEPSLPIFSRDWWLDATAGPDGWDAVLATKSGHIAGAMPYVTRQRYGMRLIGQPPLTQKLGPWIRESHGKSATRLANEREVMQALIDQLPDFDYFNQNWDHVRTNWLPFAWNGFYQTTRYTYVLEDIASADALWAGFDNSTRAECKKAASRYGLTVRDDLPLEDFLTLNRMTFSRQGKAVPYSDAFVRRLDAACAARGCRKFFIVVDGEGRQHAGNYVVWDENSAYGLMNGSDPALRNSGAVSLCMWEVIRHAAEVTRHFDFTGSMLQPIERFLRGFGPRQVPYFNITKTPSRLLRLRQGMLSVLQSIPAGSGAVS